MAIRLGGIYALERVMLDSPRDRWAIVDTLAAFVRLQRPFQIDPKGVPPLRSDQPAPLPIDIQAALTVLSRQGDTTRGKADTDCARNAGRSGEDAFVLIPHHITASLATYYHTFPAGGWAVPDFSSECPIFGAEDCARYWGFHTRHVIEPMGGLSVDDFPIMRFRCYRRGGKARVPDFTFSLLPLDLVPYRRLSLSFMVAGVLLWLQRPLSREKAEEVIEAELVDTPDTGDISLASARAQWSWYRLVWDGMLVMYMLHIACNTRSRQGVRTLRPDDNT